MNFVLVSGKHYIILLSIICQNNMKKYILIWGLIGLILGFIFFMVHRSTGTSFYLFFIIKFTTIGLIIGFINWSFIYNKYLLIIIGIVILIIYLWYICVIPTNYGCTSVNEIFYMKSIKSPYNKIKNSNFLFPNMQIQVN